jgi:hypothetical protein
MRVFSFLVMGLFPVLFVIEPVAAETNADLCVYASKKLGGARSGVCTLIDSSEFIRDSWASAYESAGTRKLLGRVFGAAAAGFISWVS